MNVWVVSVFSSFIQRLRTGHRAFLLFRSVFLLLDCAYRSRKTHLTCVRVIHATTAFAPPWFHCVGSADVTSLAVADSKHARRIAIQLPCDCMKRHAAVTHLDNLVLLTDGNPFLLLLFLLSHFSFLEKMNGQSSMTPAPAHANGLR